MPFKVKDLLISVLPIVKPADCGNNFSDPQCGQGSVCEGCPVTQGCSYNAAPNTHQCGASCGCSCSGCSNCSGCTNCTQCTGCSCSQCDTHPCTGYCTNACTAACSVCSGVTGCIGISGGGGGGCGISCRCTGGFSHRVEAPVRSPHHLAVLRQQLEQALEQVKSEEHAVEEEMQPRTLSDIELLEQKLSQALEELREKKLKLQKTKSTEKQDNNVDQ